jgi:K+-sensing histidine kinase KdpD
VYISVKDQGSGIPNSIMNNIFQRYQRQPGIEDSRYGLGLGLVLVRCAARVHGGTVLVDQPDQAGTRVTISFPIRQRTTPMVRASVPRVDYAGGWDHSLLELSDVMPAKLY